MGCGNSASVSGSEPLSKIDPTKLKAPRIVLIGGGHVNCQVLKMLKTLKPEGATLTMVSECDKSYYSGMLPGSTSNIYDPLEIQVELKPVAAWCKAEFIEKRVKKIIAKKNKIECEDGTMIDYDVLAINIGSKTRNTFDMPGVEKYSLTTRPINDLLPKIEKREKELLEEFKKGGPLPTVVVCGAGWAGIELAFGFKNRWSKVFGEEISVSILANHDSVLPHEKAALRDVVVKKLKSQNIEVHYSKKVVEVTKTGAKWKDGSFYEGNVVVWCTGAEPQPMIKKSDLATSKGYIRVNEFMQSTSHPNVFGGGDWITMAPYENQDYFFPPKAGVYAVRGGPFITRNIHHYLMGEELEVYEPQSEFLALLMTGDGRAIGTKFGIGFSGKWVWNLKDYIDKSFMRLFDPNKLFNDYKNKGTAEPMENDELFEEENKKHDAEKQVVIKRVEKMTSDDAAKLMNSDEDSTGYLDQFIILERMKKDVPFRDGVIKKVLELQADS